MRQGIMYFINHVDLHNSQSFVLPSSVWMLKEKKSSFRDVCSSLIP
jgi:hypothetical protein